MRFPNAAGVTPVATCAAAGAKTSHIRYKYDKQGRLIEAECSDDPSLDGRSRKVEFVAAAEKVRS